MKRKFKRISITDFRKTFAGRPPCANTIKKWILTNEVQGEMLGSLYFLHLDVDEQLISTKINQETNNLLLQKLIEDFENDTRTKTKDD